ncbi:MAG: glycerol-3-phosphate 1-O-acyltransferase PlsY [Rickettsiales bacterium]|nr:glycerol-3-phosphate 1-O-acyltransferase PlsY [Rickettsiales bacterium]
MNEQLLIAIAAGYFMGSIPFGLILGKLFGHDLRKIGSKSTGATNALRAGGLALAIPVLILDLAKAFFAVHIFGLWAGVAAVIGHCYPVWLGFKGGKGVASALGFLLAVWPLMAAAAFGTFVVGVILTGYSSLSAFIAMPVAVGMGFYLSANVGIAIAGLCVLILWRERSNIRRLLSGTEPKMKFKR